MFTIRKEQNQAMSESRLEDFKEKSIQFLRNNLPDWSNTKNDEELRFYIAEEHRKKIRLTDIGSAPPGSNEIFLPGVHSDVGGGYIDNSSETKLQVLDIDTIWLGEKGKKRFEAEEAWLLKTGCVIKMKSMGSISLMN